MRPLLEQRDFQLPVSYTNKLSALSVRFWDRVFLSDHHMTLDLRGGGPTRA